MTSDKAVLAWESSCARARAVATVLRPAEQEHCMFQFIKNEGGTETVEWAIFGGLIVAALITTIVALGVWITNSYSGLQTELGA